MRPSSTRASVSRGRFAALAEENDSQGQHETIDIAAHRRRTSRTPALEALEAVEETR
jgi:hypothetical protein